MPRASGAGHRSLGKSAKAAGAALVTLLALTGCTDAFRSPAEQRAERMAEYLHAVALDFATMNVDWNHDLEVTAEHLGNETCNTLDEGYSQGELMYRQGLSKAPDLEMQRWYTEMVGVAARVLCPEYSEDIAEIIRNSGYHR